jgi:hypothetical protein
MTILSALRDRSLFAPAFERGSWAAWESFLAALYGLPMSEAQLEVYRRHTGRQDAPTVPAKEGWVIAGRRAGKSRIAALLAVFIAAFRDHQPHLAPGEKATVAVIAADRQQARVVFRYITGLLEGVPMLRALIVRRTASAIELRRRVVIEVHTCSYRSTRGYSFAAVIADEVAFWRADDSACPDVEVLNALRPGLATIPGSLLVAISSPYSRRGALWTAYEKHHGREHDPVLVWQAPSVAMNPTLPASVVTEALEADEAAARAEWLGEFRSDLEAFVAREVVDGCTVPDRHELPPVAGLSYAAFVDPSGGSADAFTLAICHAEDRDGQWVTVFDCVRERKPPFSPDSVVEDFAAVLKSYGLRTVVGDRYAGSWPAERFAAHGITYTPAEHTKSDLYRELLPILNAGRVELLDLPRLRTQLLGLERRVGRSGKDSVDHAPRSHDDVANSVAGALILAAADRPGAFVPEALGDRAAYARAAFRRLGGWV